VQHREHDDPFGFETRRPDRVRLAAERRAARASAPAGFDQHFLPSEQVVRSAGVFREALVDHRPVSIAERDR
jgi:hypothetical protein